MIARKYIPTTFVSLLFSLFASSLLSGCKVDQEREIAQHRELVSLSPATAPTTCPAHGIASGITLRDALLAANARNERLWIEGENYLQALINRKRSMALFLPTADLSGTYVLGENIEGDSRNHSLDAAAIGKINIFNGFRDIARLRVSDLTIEQRRYALLDVQESLLSDVVRAYFQVLRNEQLVAVLENTLKLQNERLRDVSMRAQAGIARSLDVSQAQAQVAATQYSLLSARNALANARAALAFLTALPMDTTPLLDDGQPLAIPRDLKSALDIAIQSRKDLLAAAKARDAARQQVEVAVGQYYPSLSLNLRGLLYRETTPVDRAWDSTLQANFPLFSAGTIQADVREAWSRYRQALQYHSLLHRQIRQDVETAWSNLQSSSPRIESLRIQETAARQAVQSARGLAHAGLARDLEELIAQDQLLNARLQLTSELNNQRVFAFDLLRATGRIRAALQDDVEPSTRPTETPTTIPSTTPAEER